MSTRTAPRPGCDVDFGYSVLRPRTPWWSARIPVRLVCLALLLGAAAVLMGLLAITLGDYPLTLGEVFTTLTGAGEDFHRMIVLDWRAPVAAAAVVFGALLGIGGAIFQSLTRNPLGSPDIIGFDAGAYFAVVITILVLGSGGYWSVATAALAGGLLTACAVYLLAYRRGIQGFRLIVVGIGVSAMLGSANAYLITRAEIDDAMTVGFWGAGTITRVTWTGMVPAAALGCAIILAATALARSLRQLELGDDAATTQGIAVNSARLGLIVTGVATTALVTAAAGPIGFIALVAPQLARRITRSAGVSMFSAAMMGALLLTAAHLLSLAVAQVYRPVPVGLITVCLGGIYLIWLLMREARRHNGVMP
ncbi:FecCD family ABC transporter permease [Nesterenkonia alba]|uniref:FecCD family ABC transporter permease n=1 Tax=Nesterenkonia alba TaxID=515814 RepID=UPI0003B6B35E|nr:iron chelate uptake ABC transporter family permease subunit [Nesterenkonia alba]